MSTLLRNIAPIRYWMIALLFCLCITKCNALDFSLGLSAEAKVQAGLDPATRELIAGLPDNMKQAFLSALKDGLPLINQSIDKATKQIELAVQRTIVEGRCQITGGIMDAKGAAKDFIRTLNPLAGNSTGPTPIEDLTKDIDDTRARITANDKAKAISVIYADLIYRVGLVACQVKNSGAVPNSVVTSLDQENLGRGLIWLLWANRCGTADDCLFTAYSLIATLINTADVRDTKAANASARLLALKKPAPLTWYQRKFGSFDVDHYEQALRELKEIERAVLQSEVRRVSDAEASLQVLTAKLDEIYSWYAPLADRRKLIFNPPAIDEAIGLPTRIAAQKAGIASLAATAASIAFEVRTRVVSQIQRLSDLERDAANLAQAAQGIPREPPRFDFRIPGGLGGGFGRF